MILLSFGIALLVLFSATSKATEEDCVVGEWSDWSKCMLTSKHCTTSRSAPRSYHLDEGVGLEKGIETRNYVMKYKTNLVKTLARSRSAGTAPELVYQPKCGDFECVNGLAGDIPCSNIEQLDFLSFADMGYEAQQDEWLVRGSDVWGWTDPENGDEYAIMGITGGTTFVRITDPVHPVPVGVLYTETYTSSWRDIKVIGHYAYIVSEAYNHGLQIFDLTHLRGVEELQTFLPDATHKGFGNSHNLIANEDTNTLYAVGLWQTEYNNTCDGGLYIMNVDNPLNPVLDGCYSGDGYTHDAQCVTYTGPDTRYTGREICFSFNTVAFTIVDVTDRCNVKMLSRTGYANVGYTHQGWVTDDMTVAVMDDELDEFARMHPPEEQFTKTYVWDIRDLTDIKLRKIFESSERSIDHNQYIVGNLVFQANYEAGLRILHLDQATYTLTQVGYFDVMPSRTTAMFTGAWSVYPYFPSGNVVISSIDYGLFIVRPDYDAINSLIESGKNTAAMTRTRQILSVKEGASCPPLVETQPCEAPKSYC